MSTDFMTFIDKLSPEDRDKVVGDFLKNLKGETTEPLLIRKTNTQRSSKLMLSNIEYVISSFEDIEEILIESVGDYFLREVSEDPDMEKTVGEFLDSFREDLYFVVEYPYVDKVYRDSYYSYYASKHSAYQRDCIRVLIFEKKLNIEEFSDPEKSNKLQRDFLGYFVLRPLRTIIGRSLINPIAFENRNVKICLQKK